MSAKQRKAGILRVTVDADAFAEIAGGRRTWCALPLTQYWTSRLLFQEFDAVDCRAGVRKGGRKLELRFVGVVACLPFHSYIVSFAPHTKT
jgi:hypothetical protein